jgi:hypothetical protein
MKSIELHKYNNKSFVLILKDDDTVSQYVICSNYNGNARFGEQWDFGHYFYSFESAVDYWNEEVMEKKPVKQLELYREDFPEQSWKETLNALDLDDNQVGDAFMINASVITNTLKKSEDE